jgi:hypothetical protein
MSVVFVCYSVAMRIDKLVSDMYYILMCYMLLLYYLEAHSIKVLRLSNDDE